MFTVKIEALIQPGNGLETFIVVYEPTNLRVVLLYPLIVCLCSDEAHKCCRTNTSLIMTFALDDSCINAILHFPLMNAARLAKNLILLNF